MLQKKDSIKRCEALMEVIIGGVEGGATTSKLVLYNRKGEKLAETTDQGTNHWVIGIPECIKRINKMVEEAKTKIKMPVTSPLAALGLSLSGCEQEETNNLLKEELKKTFPNISDVYVVCSDTVGSIATASDSGGLVIIAGTGSNALLINPDGTSRGCGGWGHMLGDEGSAYWISMKAMKIYMDDEDNYVKAPFDTKVVWKAIQEHFKIKVRNELLDHCYSKFDKSFFAGLCTLLANGADKGDVLCSWIFSEAGRSLASFVKALAPHIDASLLSADGGLPVVCVGSVWNSWKHLKSGFIQRLEGPGEGPEIKTLCLLQLKTDASVGATYLAAKAINHNLPRDYNKNFDVFFKYGGN